MELFRNVEVALLLSFCLICAATFIVRPPARVLPQATAQALPTGPMPVVVITGKRLSAEEKRNLADKRSS